MSAHPNHDPTDPFDLTRFVAAQDDCFDHALMELRRVRKASHWMWFIFPQIDGLGNGATAKKYAIRSRDEASAYLHHPVVGPRLLECCRAVLSVQGKSAADIMGHPDDLKLRSSMTLFSLVAGVPSEFRDVIEKYFDGPDRLTLELLNVHP